VTYALIPAAGLSSRMGRPKLGLPLGPSTVLSRVVTALRDGGVAVVLVVVGPHVPELVPLAEAAGAEALRLAAPTADMRETVQHGLRWLAEKHRPAPDDRWLLTPGDCPAFSAATVRRMLDVPGEAVVVPTVAGRRGHPVRFTWRHAAGVLALPPGTGIDAFVRTQPVVELAVEDPGVVYDVDTPAEYDRLRRTMS
jgi:molybdenum cofactor cytidylyltransferase